MATTRFADTERTLQARLAIVGPEKVIAVDCGVRIETVSRWKNAEYPIPAYQAFAVAKSQHDYRYLQALAERAHALLFPRQPALSHWSMMQLIAQSVIAFGRFLELIEQLHRGEVLMDEEQRELEATWEKIKAAAEALIEQSRQRRREHEE